MQLVFYCLAHHLIRAVMLSATLTPIFAICLLMNGLRTLVYPSLSAIASNLAQYLPHVGAVIDGALQFYASPEAPTQATVVEEISFALLLACMYSLMEFLNLKMGKLAARIIPAPVGYQKFQDFMMTFYMAFLAAVASMMLHSAINRWLFGPLRWAWFAILLIILFGITICTWRKSGQRSAVKLLAKPVIDMLCVALIYLTIICAWILSNGNLATNAELLYAVVGFIVSVLGLTILGALSFAEAL